MADDDKGMFDSSTIASYMQSPASNATDDFESDEASSNVEDGLVKMAGGAVETIHGLLLEFGPGPIGQLADQAIDTDS